MTCDELSLEFDLLYNSINSNDAPSLNNYEKSVFLTYAQEQIIKELALNYDRTENVREYLGNLISFTTYNSSDAQQIEEHLFPNSKCFILPNDLFCVIYEYLTTTNECGQEVKVIVKPTKYDDVYRTSRNPFKRARKNEALRVNVSKLAGEGVSISNAVEIISQQNDYTYNLRYIRTPKPIILEDLSEYDLSINNETTKQECELNKNIHRNILEVAVQKASSVYRITYPTNVNNNNNNN